MANRYILEAVIAWADRADMENNLTAILSDTSSPFNNAYIWKYGGEWFFPAMSKKYDGASWTYFDSDFDDLNIRGNLQVSQFINHLDDNGDNTYISMSEDRIVAVAGGAYAFDANGIGTQKSARINSLFGDVDMEVFGTQTLIFRADADQNALTMQDNATLHFGTDRDGGAQYNQERNRIEIGASTTTRMYGSDLLLDPSGYVVLGSGHTLRFDKERTEVVAESVSHYIEAVDSVGNVIKLAIVS